MAVPAAMPMPVSVSMPMPTGSLEAYIRTVNRFPMLSAEEERRLALRFRDDADLDAARQLVLSHLRLVVAIGRGYLGYLRGQKERLLGTRGQKRVNRPELVDAHGFDTKYAMHALRLGYQGVELLQTRRVTLPMPELDRSRVMAVRRGERSFGEVVEEIGEVEQRLEAALEQTAFPDSPDDDAVNAFLVDAYRQAWGW